MLRHPTTCFVTPTRYSDVKRLAILRHSLNIFSSDIPHIVLVDTEELDKIQGQFKNERNMRFMTSAQLLPKSLEAKRLLVKRRRNSIAERISWRMGFELGPFNGWRLQQLLKMYFLRSMAYDAAVFVDSDILLCNPIDTSYFYDDSGRLKILETPAQTVEDHGFAVSSHILVGTPINDTPKFFNYIHQAPRFLKRTGQALLQRLEELHGVNQWQLRFIHQQWPSEYTLLGYAAREMEQFAGYVHETGAPDDWFYQIRFRGDEKKLDATLLECARDDTEKKFMLVQSNLGINGDDYFTKMHAFLDQIAHRAERVSNL